MSLTAKWRTAFNQTLQQPAYAKPLTKAAATGKRPWTTHMTTAVVAACQAMGWAAAAHGYKGAVLPVQRSEYLSIDVTAFAPSESRWHFPVAVFELENQQDDDYVAYNLWKLLCVRAALRVVFCYRAHGSDAQALKSLLSGEVVAALPLDERLNLKGSTVVVVGTYSTQDMFPYSFFKWWQLDKNTGNFLSM